jgi:lysyl-tRNA synthetase class 2
MPIKPDDDNAPTAHWPTLQARARLLQRTRAFFDERAFVEVETPLLSADSVVDRHLDPLPVTLFSEPTESSIGRTLWLQTSPEFAMKRLLAAGADRIYQITHGFRAGESGRLHNPEFTILEWYRIGDDLDRAMDLLGEFSQCLLGCEFHERLSYQDAFQRFVGVDPHCAGSDQLEEVARSRGIEVSRKGSPDRDDWLHLLLTDCVEPQLGQQHPVIVYDYPASQAALAQIRDTDPPVAERFELYYHGVELANGYHELLDGPELLRRNRAANQARSADGKYTLPEDSRLLSAMMQQQLPPCAGVAVGFDRLVMVALGASHIDEVIPFPIDRA